MMRLPALSLLCLLAAAHGADAGQASRRKGSGKKESGWTRVTPARDSRVVYVSSSRGDDSNDGLSPARPLKTLTSAKRKIRNGKPDWMVLKAGDVWEEAIGDWKGAGRSEREPCVITSFGTGPRPLLKTGGAPGIWRGNPARMEHVYVIGLDFYDNTRDPGSPDYRPNSPGKTGFTWVGSGKNILIEDCRFRSFGLGINLQPSGTGPLAGVRIRRCQILDSYNVGSHSQGLYAERVEGLRIEECLFDHNGWNENVTGAKATMFNHNTYITSCRDVEIRGTLFFRASSMANKFVSSATDGFVGLKIENNLYVEGEIGISVGGRTQDPSRFRDVVIRDNVFLHVGRSRPTGRELGWCVSESDVNGGEIRGNLFLHQPPWQNAYGVHLGGGSERDLAIQENLFFGIHGRGIKVDARPGWKNVRIGGNVLAKAERGAAFVEHQGGFATVRYAANTYEAAAASAAFRVDGRETPFGTWVRQAGAAGSRTGRDRFPDPERTLATYQASQRQPATMDAFLKQARAQCRGAWRTGATADAVNRYLRAGFGIR